MPADGTVWHMRPALRPDRAVTMSELLVVILILGLLISFVPYVTARMASSSQDVQVPTVLESVVPEVVAAALSTPAGTLPSEPAIYGWIDGPAAVPTCVDDPSPYLTDGSGPCPTGEPVMMVDLTMAGDRLVAAYQEELSRCWAVSIDADGGQWWAASADATHPMSDCRPTLLTVPSGGSREQPATL